MAPSKNSIFEMEPSTSLALDVIVIFDPIVKVALLAGLVMLTAGGLFALTVIDTAEEVAVALELSVALAVME